MRRPPFFVQRPVPAAVPAKEAIRVMDVKKIALVMLGIVVAIVFMPVIGIVWR